MDADSLVTRKNPYSWLFVAWAVVSAVWISQGLTECLPSYLANYNEVLNYSELLREHSMFGSVLENPIIAFVVTFVIGIALLFRAKRWWLGFLFLPLVALTCLMFTGGLFCDQTTLQHVDTIQFDGHVYHLTLGDDVAGGADVFSTVLFLHECEQDGETCRGQEIERTYLTVFSNVTGLKLRVDAATNQLQVFVDNQVVFTLDARTLPIAVPQNREQLRLENIQQIQEFTHFRFDHITELAWSHDGTFLAAAGHNALWLHDFRAGTVTTETIPVNGSNSYTSGTTNIAFGPSRNVLAASGALNGSVQLWNIDNGIDPISFPAGYGDAVAFSPDGQFIATSRDRKLLVLDAATFTELAVLTETSWHYAIDDLVFSPDGSLLAASGFDHNDEDGRNFVRVWNMQSNNEILFFRGPHGFSLNPLAIAPDGNRLAFSTIENLNPNYYPEETEVRLYVWNLQENAEQYSAVLPSDIYQINDLVWMPDGKVIITSDNRHSIQFWNAATGDIVGSLAGETGVVSLLAMSPDGTILATSDIDGTIRLWAVPLDG